MLKAVTTLNVPPARAALSRVPQCTQTCRGWPVLRDSHSLFKWQKISFPDLPQLCSIHVPIISEYKDEGEVNFYIANRIQLSQF